MNEVENHPVSKLCAAIHISRSSYYKWLKRMPSNNQILNEQLAEWIKHHYEDTNGILGYRQMTIVINREHKVNYNRKRI